MKQVLIPAAFNPAASAVDFSNVAGFNPTLLLAIINASAREVIYDPTTNGLGLASIAGSVLTLQANISTQSATDRVLAFYDDGQSPASSALQPGLNADGGALSHVTNFPSSQVVTGTFWQATQPVSLSALPVLASGSNVIGGVTQSGAPWSVSWSGQSVGVSSLPALAAGANVIGSVAQSGPWNIGTITTLPALPAGANTIGSVKVTDGVNTGAVKAASTAAAAADPAQVVALSPNSPIPPGSNAIGSVGVSNFPSTQTIAGSVSVSNFPSTQSISAASLPLPSGAGTAANQVSILTALQGSLSVSDAQSAPFAGAVALTPGTTSPATRSIGVLCTTAGAVEFQFPDASTLTLPVGVGWQTFPFAVTQIIAAGTTASATYYNLK